MTSVPSSGTPRPRSPRPAADPVAGAASAAVPRPTTPGRPADPPAAATPAVAAVGAVPRPAATSPRSDPPLVRAPARVSGHHELTIPAQPGFGIKLEHHDGEGATAQAQEE